MTDRIVGGYLEHEVKKIWKNIVSCGSYTIDKCKKYKVGLRLCYLDQKMSIPLSRLESESFHLHSKIIQSKFGQDYTMFDFKWEPDSIQSLQLGLFDAISQPSKN